MNKLLVICGPTATGKTSLALHLAKVIGGEIVSADSRQVYKGMDIGTGKDLPANSKLEFRNSKLGFYTVNGVRVWGYDLVEPKEVFSVAQYAKAAGKIIENIEKRGKLPIMVGGTGLYIKAVVDGISTLAIPRNEGLRSFLGKKTKEELLGILANIDPFRSGSLNSSDGKNPRRLVRAIEIAEWEIERRRTINFSRASRQRKFSSLFIGLTADRDILYKKVDGRVRKRIKDGLEEELNFLIKNGVSWESQAMQSLGYRQWREYFDGQKSREEVIKKWESDEKGYVRRQITWFKKDKRINWFDITSKNYRKKVEILVKKWDNRKIHA